MRLPPLSHWILPAVLGVAAIAIAATPLGQRADLALFDLAAKVAPTSRSTEVVLVAIDETSTAKLGADVWKPELQALVLQRLLSAGARAVGYVQFEPHPALPATALRELRERINQADEAARPSLLQLDESLASLERSAKDIERLNRLVMESDRVFLPDGSSASANVGLLGVRDQAKAVEARMAHVNFVVDDDGRIRSFPIRAGGPGNATLAMPIELVRKAGLNSPLRDESAMDGRIWLSSSLAVGSGVISVPLVDVVTKQVAAEVVNGKIVVVGVTAGASAMPVMIPGRGATSLAMLEAQAVADVLSGDIAMRTRGLAALAIFLCVATAALGGVLRSMTIQAAMVITMLWAGALIAAQVIGLAAFHVWFSGVAPAVFALLLPLCVVQNSRTERRGMFPQKVASHGGDRLLALAFHEQGQLDHAFDHLRRCPPTETVLDDLYELGLDYERRRQYAKAQQVFDHIAARSPQRRELLRRAASKPAAPESAPAASEPVHLGVRRLSDTAGAAHPQRLGRYELGRELGRGAMGVVYLGRDTTIGRAVAIKTMPLSQEFDAAELESVKRRFFGEAESAGRLNHPNIVTIYDAGEDQELAYIAMELLTGKDLSRYTAPSRLLPLAVVLNIVGRVADALDYAHRLNIVHRDIKPGNIMFDPKTDAVKVTDFGIARITDSNKTKTGMVLGTPSFMSPEQLAGKKIDGQSDLYSLGVTLYQLVCGTLPFQAASLAQLMYKISNDAPADPLNHNPSLPDELVSIIQKVLAKEKQQRFASGSEMALALRNCGSRLMAVDIAL